MTKKSYQTTTVNPSIKKKFQYILVWVLILTNTLLTGALSDYWLYKTQEAKSYVEIVGITGGIIKIFQIINNTIGRFMLKILKRCVKKESRKFKQVEISKIQAILRLKRVHSACWRDLDFHTMPLSSEHPFSL